MTGRRRIIQYCWRYSFTVVLIPAWGIRWLMLSIHSFTVGWSLSNTRGSTYILQYTFCSFLYLHVAVCVLDAQFMQSSSFADVLLFFWCLWFPVRNCFLVNNVWVVLLLFEGVLQRWVSIFSPQSVSSSSVVSLTWVCSHASNPDLSSCFA